jgi:putative ABC transport system permease protein
MVKNYLRIALRNIFKNKLNSLLNISCLTLGMVCFILVSLYIINELSYERHHRNAENIFRIVKKVDSGNGLVKNSACSPNPLADALKFEYPDIVNETVRFWNYWGLGFNVQYKKNIFNEVNFAFTDSTVFNIFSFEFVKGNPAGALNVPFTAVLTESAARKYFGEEEPIGKSLRVNDGYDILITGIIRDMLSQSHFHFNILTSYKTLEQLPWRRFLESWRDEDFCYTYLLLNDGISPEILNQKFPEFFQKKYLPAESRETNFYYLQPLVDIHLTSGMDNELETSGSRITNFILFSIATFILIISIINYINLTTVSYTARIKEIGIRKVLGAQRTQLIFQFIAESTVLCFSALLLSLGVIEFILPQFSTLAGKSLSFNLVGEEKVLILLAFLGILISLLSGAYPAFYVSSFRPAEVLGSSSKVDFKRGLVRKMLVVSQLIIASFLIIGTIMIHRQLTYINRYDFKYDKDNILLLPVNQTPISSDHYDVFIDEITQNSHVISATGMRTIAGYDHIKENFKILGSPSIQNKQVLPFLLVRHHFLETFDIQLISGRDFSIQFPGDEIDAILINETYARQVGWQNDEVIGRRLHHPGWGILTIIGVVKDFHFESLHSPIKPLVIKMIWPVRKVPLTDYIAVRISPHDIQNTIQFIGNKWKQFAPNSAFEYFFLDQKLNDFYKSEETLRKLSSILTVIGIVIACLGLVGLISYIVEWRTREIAVRKVLGASVAGILGLLSKEFVMLILIANILAWPIAYVAVRIWLQSFAYHIDISPWIFMLAAIVTFVASILVIVFQILKAAFANPVDFLRYE